MIRGTWVIYLKRTELGMLLPDFMCAKDAQHPREYDAVEELPDATWEEACARWDALAARSSA